MKNAAMLVLMLSITLQGQAQIATPNDGDWSRQSAALLRTPEAEYMIRTGDIDNLGFGFEPGFNPFCGRSTQSHFYPWDPVTGDAAGTDRILLPTSYRPENAPCGSDGYSTNFGNQDTRPVPIELNLSTIKGAIVKDAWLQLFIDDFQAPVLCSKFRLTLNGKRFIEAEKILNTVNQTGPIGKLVTFSIPEEFYTELQKEKLLIYIDDPASGAGDGYAIDFVKLIVNRHHSSVCKGNANGLVLDEETQEPIVMSTVRSTSGLTALTSADGSFQLAGLPAGLEMLTASAKGYIDGSGIADVGEGDTGDPVVIFLKRSDKKAAYDGRNVAAGESLIINNILFDQGSAVLKSASMSELDKIVRFLQDNPGCEIELLGHTSSEGDIALNKSLSYKRVLACKEYIVAKGIDTGRIIAVGFGPDRPVASNSTESGRMQNRRVEMRILRL